MDDNTKVMCGRASSRRMDKKLKKQGIRHLNPPLQIAVEFTPNGELYDIIIHHEPISPVNAYKPRARGMGLALPPRFSDYKEAISDAAEQFFRGEAIEVYEGPVSLKVKEYFGTLRKKDLSNGLKLELDALNGLLYIDDSQITKERGREKLYDKKDPRLELSFKFHKNCKWPKYTKPSRKDKPCNKKDPS